MYLIRCLAGDRKARYHARKIIRNAKGDRNTVIVIARLVGIAVITEINIQTHESKFLSSGEKSLISLIARLQIDTAFPGDTEDAILLEAARDAATALKRMGIFLSTVQGNVADKT